MEARDLRGFATKAATPTMEAFADFLIAKVYGGTLPVGIDEAAFRKGVALGGSTRMDFQRSEEWKSDPRNYLANVDARRAEKAAEAIRKAEAAAAKNAARLAKARATLAALEAASGSEAAEEGSEAAEAASAAEEGSEAAEAPTPANVARRTRRGRNVA